MEYQVRHTFKKEITKRNGMPYLSANETSTLDELLRKRNPANKQENPFKMKGQSERCLVKIV